MIIVEAQVIPVASATSGTQQMGWEIRRAGSQVQLDEVVVGLTEDQDGLAEDDLHPPDSGDGVSGHDAGFEELVDIGPQGEEG